MTDTYDKINHWYGWNSGECPVHDDTLVEVKFLIGSGAEMAASQWEWNHSGEATEDIIAFRITRLYVEPKVPREWWVAISDHGLGPCIFYTQEDADRISEHWNNAEVIHVREVLEPGQ